MNSLTAIDLFAGPGGWDVGAAALGVDPLGIEFDDGACATREAAGLRTLQGDVAALDPMAFGPVDLLIASPPCQAWSMAGKRQGQLDIAHVHALTDWLAGTAAPPDHEPEWNDPRSALVTEPLRWALALRPRWLAFEQVPPVLDYWRHVARALNGHGYRTWAGILSAEEYGVPQTRRRAILLADRDGQPQPPAPTHQAYKKGDEARGEATLFGELPRWISMAEALGWDEDEGTGQATAQGEGMVERHGERQPRQASDPAPHITGKTRSWERVRVGFPRRDDTGTSEDGYRERDTRPATAPTFNLTEKARSWQRFPSHLAKDDCNREGAGNLPRPVDAPAPAVTTRLDRAEWTGARPASTITTTRKSRDGLLVGRQLPPGEAANTGGHNWDQDTGERTATSEGDAVRVTRAEAAVLQGFPADYPWQGSRTKQFQQIGNAVPPPLAAAILRALIRDQVSS